jgi:hypothetical protein
MTGGRRGRCAGDSTISFGAQDASRGGGRLGRGGGRGHRGHRNQYYATGLTGWQRALVGTRQEDAAPDAADDRFAQIERRLDQLTTRLTHLEGTE